MFSIEASEFRDAKPGGKEKLKKRSVAEIFEGSSAWRGEKPVKFFYRKKFYAAVRHFGDIHLFGGKRGDILRGKVLEEASKGYEVIVLCGNGKRFSRASRAAIELFSIIMDLGEGDLGDGSKFLGVYEVEKIAPVIGDGERASALFYFKMIEEVVDVVLNGHVVTVYNFSYERTNRARTYELVARLGVRLVRKFAGNMLYFSYEVIFNTKNDYCLCRTLGFFYGFCVARARKRQRIGQSL